MLLETRVSGGPPVLSKSYSNSKLIWDFFLWKIRIFGDTWTLDSHDGKSGLFQKYDIAEMRRQ